MNKLQFVIEFLLKNKERLDAVISSLKEKHNINIDTADADSAMAGLQASVEGIDDSETVIDADSSGAVDAANEAEAEIEEIPEEHETDINATDNSTSIIIAISTGYMALMQVIGKVKYKIEELINLSGEQEKAEKLLQVSIKNTGDESSETFEKFKDLASSMQEVTTIGDETTMEVMRLGLNMGVMTEDLEAATKGAIGLSKSLDLDLKTAMKMHTLAMAGDYNMLQRYLPALKTAKDDAEKMAIVKKAEADGWRMATAETETGYGALEQYKNLAGDVKEKIGNLVTVAMLPFVQVLSDAATGMNDMLTIPLSEKISEERIEFNSLVGVLKDANTHQATRNAAIETLQTQYSSYIGNIDLEKASYDELVKVQKISNEEFRKKIAQEAASEALLEAKTEIAKETKKMIDLEIQLQNEVFGTQEYVRHTNQLWEHKTAVYNLTVEYEKLEKQLIEKGFIEKVEEQTKNLTKATEGQTEVTDKSIEALKKYYEAVKFEDTNYKAWKIQQINDEIAAMEISEDKKITLKKQKLDELDQAEEDYQEKKKEKAEKAGKEISAKELADQKQFYVALKFEDSGYMDWKKQQIETEIDEMELTEDQKIVLKKQKLDELEQAEDSYRESKKEKETDLVLFLQELSRSSLDGMISEIDELFNYKQERSNEDIELEMKRNEINHQARLAEIAAEMQANRAAGKDNTKLMLEQQKLENAYAKQKKKLNKEIADNNKSLSEKAVDVMKAGAKSAIMMLAKEAMAYAFKSVMSSLAIPFPLNLVLAPIAAATAYAGVSAFASGLNEGGLLGDEHDKKVLEQYIPQGEDMLIAVKKGEYVLKMEAVRKYFPIIDQMNELSYADGGLVGDAVNYGLEVSSGAGGAVLQILMEIRDINKSGFEKKSDVTVNNEFNIELDGDEIAHTVEDILNIEEERTP